MDDERAFEPVPGLAAVRTRRSLTDFREPRGELPLCRLEPAVLLFAACTRSPRATGLLAACVQQRLTTPQRLVEWTLRMRPLRRSRQFQADLAEMSSGAQSVAELDVRRMCRRFELPLPRRQVKRRDGHGHLRYTDCEWPVPGGTVVLEVDGAFHMDVESWEQDLARQRALTTPGRLVVRATAHELRADPERVAVDLVRFGVRSCA
ncbi:DUF559 domain-containing protein [Marmoricola endophyticus]|uniref:DUF559 domain-containing protein n=1 Tax=Marmoricola endophyticus TaxID=2040280 RepID=UPI0016645F80|nr:DUF559 domain-containing protein [Marmoricola endophyticus]